MRFKLPDILSRVRTPELEQPPQETFIDIIGQNLFLRRLTLTLGIALCALSGLLAWQACKQDRVVFILQPSNTKYADEISAPPVEPPADPANVKTDDSQKPTISKVTEAPPKIPATTDLSAPARPPSKPTVPETQRRIGLWDLMEQLKSDSRRETLEKTFNTNGIQIAFKEVSPKGLISFELINESQNPLYMPSIQIPGKPHTVYLERRVLEKGTKCAGIIQMGSLEETSTLQLKFTAANAKSVNLTLEVPRW